MIGCTAGNSEQATTDEIGVEKADEKEESAEKPVDEDIELEEDLKNTEESEEIEQYAEEDMKPEVTMSDKQLSSIAMLNHMTVLSQEINASSNSRLYLDNAYSDIVNNINPNAVDEDTLSQITELLNTIYAYQSIETKRERLKYIYDQNQANALQKAIPDPLSVLNVVQSDNIFEAIGSVVYMAVDSKASYDSYLTEIENKYLEDGWKLDDSAVENLHESRKDAFSYMVEMCQKNELDGKLALNEKSVESFVSWENTDNVTRKVEFLENNQSTYQAYGKYWLVLAEGYYEQKEYQKCLDAISKYGKMNVDTFRKDHDYAKAMSLALVAANAIYPDLEFVDRAETYVENIINNIEPEDWSLRYLVSQTYLNMYARTEKVDYLQKALDYTEENVNYLIDEQHQKNAVYLADVVKEESKKSDSKEKKKEIKQYNKWLEEEREVELPPVYQPLVLNCDLLFSLADELQISDTEKNKIDQMLHDEKEPLFLVETLDKKYWFNEAEGLKNPNIEFDGDTFEIPANYLMQGCTIKTTVSNGNKKTTYDDWTIEKVDRNKQKNVSEFEAVIKSKKIKKQDYTKDSRVILEIIPPKECGGEAVVYEFKTSVKKKLFVFNDVNFEMVK